MHERQLRGLRSAGIGCDYRSILDQLHSAVGYTLIKELHNGYTVAVYMALNSPHKSPLGVTI
jgi:hypothetical protein